MNASSRKPYRSDQADVHWETLLESGRWLGGQPRGAVLREVVNRSEERRVGKEC